MITFLIVILVIVSLLCLYSGSLILQVKRTEKFQQDAKMGDLCYIYIGQEKTKSRIVAIFDHSITVEDEDGMPHVLPRCEIYPIGFHLR